VQVVQTLMDTLQEPPLMRATQVLAARVKHTVVGQVAAHRLALELGQ
jgi:hypothetical protein